MNRISGRTLTALAALVLLSAAKGVAVAQTQRTTVDSAATRPAIVAEAFDLADVTLLDSPFKQAMDRNRAYLLRLEPDRFLRYFRVNAHLTPKAPGYGGWESPTTGAGRCLGHYLSALAMQYRATGDEAMKQRIEYIVDDLAVCQAAGGDGFLSAQAGLREAFARLAAGRADALKNERVPWYIQHKMFAGLRDACLLAGSANAKAVLLKMADWACAVTKGLSDEQFQTMLETEFGSMQEVLADIYAFSGDARYLDLALRFHHRKAEARIAGSRDDLAGTHANTQIPEYIGAARLYELTGSVRDRELAEAFWDRVANHHSYVNGGNSDHEHFQEPDKLAWNLSPLTAETCNVYNMLKLTRHLFAWQPKVTYADFYERALYNQILASQDPRQGMYTYYLTLTPGHNRVFSTPLDSFWCCVGTGMENHAKYGESIYFHDWRGIYVNLFLPSQLRWKDKGLVLRQETRYPENGSVRFTMNCAKPVRLALRIRHPGWAGKELALSVNGRPIAVASKPGDYAVVDRLWHDGDVLYARIPFGLRTEAMPDDARCIAILYGPLVLGGRLDADPDAAQPIYTSNPAAPLNASVVAVPTFAVAGRPVSQWVEPVAGQPLMFRTKGVGRPHDVTLVPFYRQYYEHSAIYWRVTSENKVVPQIDGQ